jgi:hypothetical protein
MMRQSSPMYDALRSRILPEVGEWNRQVQHAAGGIAHRHGAVTSSSQPRPSKRR